MKIIKRFDKKMCIKDGCPAIMKDEQGNFIIIGTDVTGKVENLEEFGAGCNSNEAVVMIPREIFESALKEADEQMQR